MMELNKIYCIDCLEGMKALPDNSVDSIVTDPPAGISFMGKEWDANKGGRDNWIAWLSKLMKEGLRVLKPGGHAFVWALPRTSHWTAMALENAGFEIRDCVYHVFGSGFPKSLNIGKKIDELRGNEREIIGISNNEKDFRDVGKKVKEIEGIDKLSFGLIQNAERKNLEITKGNSEWEGWHTSLKPAVECWWLCRKPLSEKTVAENVLKWGVGGLNIDACRIPAGTEHMRGNVGAKVIESDWKNKTGFGKPFIATDSHLGRFPSHLTHDGSDEVLAEFCESRERKTTWGTLKHPGEQGFNDSGSAARFFYCTKASRAERDEGLEGMEERQQDESRKEGNPGGDNPRNRGVHKRVNFHPTVKPIELMKYLIKLITPKGSIVLDMFAGSGSTLVAAKYSGFNFIGFELSEDYCKIAEKRLSQKILSEVERSE